MDLDSTEDPLIQLPVKRQKEKKIFDRLYDMISDNQRIQSITVQSQSPKEVRMSHRKIEPLNLSSDVPASNDIMSKFNQALRQRYNLNKVSSEKVSVSSPIMKASSPSQPTAVEKRKQLLSEFKPKKKPGSQVSIKGKQTEAQHIVLLDGQQSIVYPVETSLTFNNIRDQQMRIRMDSRRKPTQASSALELNADNAETRSNDGPVYLDSMAQS